MHCGQQKAMHRGHISDFEDQPAKFVHFFSEIKTVFTKSDFTVNIDCRY